MAYTLLLNRENQLLMVGGDMCVCGVCKEYASLPRSTAVWPTRNTCIMFLNEVALGKTKEIVMDDRTLKKAPPGFDSVVARGRTEPSK